jgi:hypothetical protein
MQDVGVPPFEPATLAIAFVKRLNHTYSPLLVDVMNMRCELPSSFKEIVVV